MHIDENYLQNSLQIYKTKEEEGSRSLSGVSVQEALPLVVGKSMYNLVCW